MSSTGSDGDRRDKRKVRRSTPKSVGIAWTSLRAMNRPIRLQPRGPDGAIRPGRADRASPLLLEPPFLDVPLSEAVRVRVDVLQLLVCIEVDVRRIQEGVRGVLVQVLVDLLQRGLPRRLAAVRPVAVVDE